MKQQKENRSRAGGTLRDLARFTGKYWPLLALSMALAKNHKTISGKVSLAKMLREKRTYLDIAESTGASTATISRVNRSLNYGNDGYEMVFERLNK